MMGAVFAMQGIGQFTAGIIALIVASGFKESLLTAKSVDLCDGVCQLAVDKMWRIIIGFGAVPGCFALYFRLTIPETPRYTFDVARDSEKAVEDVKAYKAGVAEGKPDEVSRAAVLQDSRTRLDPPKASWSDFIRHYGQWKHGKVLLGTAGSWFFLDVAFVSTPRMTERYSANIGSVRSWSQQLHHSDCHWFLQGFQCLRDLPPCCHWKFDYRLRWFNSRLLGYSRYG